MRIDVVTLFPEMIRERSGYGIQGRAIAQGVLELVTWNPRDFTTDRHRNVDDRPYGGGPGMVMQVQPLRDAIRAARAAGPAARVICLSPQGARFDQQRARELATQQHLILVAGRYEGIDERLVELEVDEELSVGDFVLSGGELPALMVMDAVTRLSARCAGCRGFGAAGFLHGRPAGLSALHAAGADRRQGSAGGAAERRPRRDPALAPQAGAGQDLAAAPGPAGAGAA